jgi:hypothetical protein
MLKLSKKLQERLPVLLHIYKFCIKLIEKI